MSGVSGVSGALGNEGASVVVSTDKPVLSDDSGIRAAVMKWGVWAICLIAVLLGGALVLTLRTHVALPGVDRLLPPSRGQIERVAVSPTEESPSQPPQPSITLRPSITFRPTDAKPSPTVKRAAPTADATSAAPTRTRTPAAGATASAQETTMVRNPKAANPTPRGSRPTSKPGNGPR
jgi:cytoskeletal protein RodZ